MRGIDAAAREARRGLFNPGMGEIDQAVFDSSCIGNELMRRSDAAEIASIQGKSVPTMAANDQDKVAHSW